MAADMYQDEINRLKTSDIYNQLVANRDRRDDNGCDALVGLVHEAVHYCYQRSKAVMVHMKEFTLHDGEHLFRVLQLMGMLMPKTTLEKLSNPELALLILTAFFHDMGMAPSDWDVKCWLQIWEGKEPTPQELAEHQKYARFRLGKPLQVVEIEKLRMQDKYGQAELLERYIVTDYIRVTHADRIISILRDGWAEKIMYKDVDLATELATLCRSHNEDAANLREMESSLVAGNGVFICLPFIGVMLRLADILDFDGNRTPKVLFAHLGVKDSVSIAEWQKHRAVGAWTMPTTPGDKIVFNAVCTHPAIESTINQFCDTIDYELSVCSNILSNLHDSIRKPFPEYYKIQLPSSVERSKIKAKRDLSGDPLYIYRDTKFTLNKEQIIDLLMGTKLYGRPEVALRELLQNSIDTCKLRRELEHSWGISGYAPNITIRFIQEGEESYLEVEDNGMGKDQDIIDKYYSKVGTSYYKSAEFIDVKASINTPFVPTSRFGIGILSCFMITEVIEVETKRLYKAHDSAAPLSLTITGSESIFYIKKGKRETPGTTTRLLLKQNHPWTGISAEDVFETIKWIVSFPPFDFNVEAYGKHFEYKTRDLSQVPDSNFRERAFNKGPENGMQEVRVEFNGEAGITGGCIVFILENQGEPVRQIETESTKVEFAGNSYELKSRWNADVNKIRYSKDALAVNSLHQTVVNASDGEAASSLSQVALHGITVPMSLFHRDSYYGTRRGAFGWPLCIWVSINLENEADINLNSARTEFIIDEKWYAFERILLTLILDKLRDKLAPAYWKQFFECISNYHPIDSVAHEVLEGYRNEKY